MKTKFTLVAAFVLISFGLAAQPQGDWQSQEQPRQGQFQGQRPPQGPPQMKTPAEIAKMQADMMQRELGLDKKQYKKVYNLVKKDQEYRQNAMQSRMGGMPPMGGGPGMGGPGGGNMGGGMPGGGFGGGMMGGGPGMGGGMPGGGNMGGGAPPQGGMQPGQRPEGAPGMGPGESAVTEEYLEKQDKKLRKILTPEQYDRWRSKHPAEHQELPPMELKMTE